MKAYPSYKASDVLDEYASRFFLLLKWATVLDATQKLELIQIACSPYMKRPQLKQLTNFYKKMLRDIEPGGYATIQKDREALKKRLKGLSL